MSKLPTPPDPATLRLIRPHWHLLPPGTEIWRVYRAAGPFAQSWDTFRSWGPHPDGRFDHHLPPSREQDRSSYYAAESIVTGIAEAFQRSGVVSTKESSPWLVSFALTDTLWLLDLRGTWPTRAGASMALNSTLDRDRTQAWSRAIYEAYPPCHGLWYASSMHANEPAVFLTERAIPYLPSQPTFHVALDDPSLQFTLATAAHTLGYVLE